MKSVLVVGTGTIGEPLIGLLALLRNDLGIDDVLFYKRTPLVDEVAKVASLCSKGAQLVVTDLSTADKFNTLGNHPKFLLEAALDKVDVVIDCTPEGNRMKADYYDVMNRERKCTFIAQGSEKGFGMPYAYGINDEALKNSDRFIQVVSCNTHNIASIISSLNQTRKVLSGDFVCVRRANDISQDGGYVASPTVSEHSDRLFGTHHARDVHDLFTTVGKRFNIFSSAMKTNSQYMHIVRFSVSVEGNMSMPDVVTAFRGNRFISLTHKTSANKIFSFGRDHGHYGRIYNHAVVPIPGLYVRNVGGTTSISGFSYTPQDGNSLLSSAAAAVYGLHGEEYKDYLAVLDQALFDSV